MITPPCIAALLTLPLKCSAAVVCTDDWGHRYVMPVAVAAEDRAMRCEALPDAVPRVQHAPDRAGNARGDLLVQVDNSLWVRTGMRLVEAPGVSRMTPLDPALESLIDDVGRRFGPDARLLRAVVEVESRGNPNAVSSKGAIGLMQVMPSTAEGMGFDDARHALFDPAVNLQAGARHLRLLLGMFSGQLELVLAAYNAGEGAVIRFGGSVPPFPETQSYVRQVLERYAQLRNP